MLSRPSCLACLLLCVVSAVLPGVGLAAERSGVYRLLDDEQSIHLTDRPQGAQLVVAGESASPPTPIATAALPKGPSPAVNAIVRQAAQVNGLDPNLLHAVIATESAYVNAAVSRRGAQGLMQLMPATARSLGVTNAFDARQNIGAGARYLRSLLDAFDQDTRLALAAYNAGAAAVERHGRRIPPFAETAAYVPRVMNHLAALQVASASPP